MKSKEIYYICTRKGLFNTHNQSIIPERDETESNMKLEEYIREKRKLHNLTQQELAERSGVGYRFVRELENGKSTVRMDKVNQVLRLFGEELQPAKINHR